MRIRPILPGAEGRSASRSALDEGGRYLGIPGNGAFSWFTGIRGAGRAACLAMLLSACTKPADELLWQASMRGRVDDMKLFLQQGADPNYVRGGHSILMRLAREGRADIAEILIDSGAKVNFKGKDGASALTVAAEHGNTGVARVLLAKGADVNIRNNHGNTALMYAAQYGHPEMVRLLLAAGADVTPKDRDGDTALRLTRLIEIGQLLREAGARE